MEEFLKIMTHKIDDSNYSMTRCSDHDFFIHNFFITKIYSYLSLILPCHVLRFLNLVKYSKIRVSEEEHDIDEKEHLTRAI